MAIFGIMPVYTAVNPLYNATTPSRWTMRLAVPNGPNPPVTVVAGTPLVVTGIAVAAETVASRNDPGAMRVGMDALYVEKLDVGVDVVDVETMMRFLYPPGSILLPPIVVGPAFVPAKVVEDAFPPTRIVCVASFIDDDEAPSARLVIVVCLRNCIRVFIVSNG